MLALVGLAASPLRALDPRIGAKIGTSVGSPVPFGDIPEGATGSPILGLVAGFWVDWYAKDTWTVVSEVQYVHYGASFSTPLENHPIVDRVPVSAPDGTTVIYEVETVFTGTATGEFSNDYVQFPVYAAWMPLDQWRFTGGGYVGWLVSTNSYAVGKGQVGIRPEVIEQDMYFNEKINGLDYGSQPLAFPRSALRDDAGRLVIGIPRDLKIACAEYAVRAHASPLAPDPSIDASGRAVTLEKIGPIETRYSEGGSIDFVIKPYPAADYMLKGYLKAIGGSYR